MKHSTLLIVALASHLAVATAAPLPSYLDANTNFVVGVNVRAAAQSPVIMQAIEQAGASASDAPWAAGILQQAISLVDEVIITGNVEGGGSGAPDDGYVWLRGNGSSEALQNAICGAGCQPQSHAGLDYLALPASMSTDGQSPHILTIDSNLIALASEPRIRALAERMSGGQTASLQSGLLEWVDSLSGHHIWLAALGPFEAPGGDGGFAMGAEAMSKLVGFGLGVTVADPLRVGLEIRASTAADASELYNLANGLLAMAKMSQAADSDSSKPDLLKDFSMNLDGTSVRASLSVPQSELAQLSQNARKTNQSDTAPAQPAPRPTRKPRSGGGIQVHGMSGGVREFPVDP